MSQHKICSNEIVNQNLNHLYEVISDIPYNPNDLKHYFENIFERMSLRRNEQYLQNAECLSIYNFYNYICSQLHMTKSQSDDVNSLTKIEKDFVVTLKIPAVPGNYHFITAIVSPKNKSVDIYQSYGGSRKLYVLSNLPLNYFLKLLQDCKELTTGQPSNYYYNMLKFKRIGRVLSRIMDLECKALENDTITFTHDYADDDDDDPDNINKLMKLSYSNHREISQIDRALGFCNNEAIKIIHNDYLKFIGDTSKQFIMNIFLPTTSGGKFKKFRKSISKKYKRKTRKTQRTKRY